VPIAMRDDRQILHLVGEVYDAALDPACWPAALKLTTQFVSGAASSIFSQNVASRTGHAFYQDGGIPQDFVDSYFGKYVKLDPTTTAQYFASADRPVSTVDLIDYDEFVECQFFKEWATPLQLVDTVMTVISKTENEVSMCGVFRNTRQGLVDDKARRQMAMIAPHIRRAVLIGNIIEQKTVEAATFENVLNGMVAAMYLLSTSGQIIHANAAGRAMLAAGDVLKPNGGRLTANDPDVNALLRQSLAASGQGDAALGVMGVAMALLGGNGKRYVAHLLPLTSGARRRTGDYFRAVASLFVYEAAPRTAAFPELIAKHYALTPSELRVLLAIVQTGGVTEASEALGIAESTVRWHLRHLFEKTKTRQQTDLVRLVAGYSSPVRA
jgi:DNA-binding CsgD family transcriptional regulator